MTDKSAAFPSLQAISFADRLQSSEQFDQLFKEGMALVERTAVYLDGPGRKESKGHPSHVTVLYATESMRLTTRLLDLASWLLLRRALRDGEITPEEATAKRAKVKLQSLGRPSHIKNFDELPRGLKELILASFVIHDRIVQLDRALARTPDLEEPTDFNPVAAHLNQLERAFGRAR